MNFWSTSSEILKNEAEALWLLVDIIDEENNLFFIIHWDKKILFKNTDFWVNSALWFKLVQDKSLCYSLLERYDFSIAKSLYIHKKEFGSFRENLIEWLWFPLVIKPLSEAHGNGVCMNIYTYNELKEKLTHSFEKYESMIIQEQIDGDEIRIVVYDDQVLAAYIRKPPFIVWDGISTIEALIYIENNTNPLRWPRYQNVLCNIEIDKEVLHTLQKGWFNLDSIPEKRQQVFLRSNSNIWTWGTLIDVSHILHDDIKKSSISACRVFWLWFSGVDIIIKDPSKLFTRENWVILEINATPWIWGHMEALWLNTWKKILKKLFQI